MLKRNLQNRKDNFINMFNKRSNILKPRVKQLINVALTVLKSNFSYDCTRGIVFFYGSTAQFWPRPTGTINTIILSPKSKN